MKKFDLSRRPAGRLLQDIAPTVLDIGARGGADEEMLDVAWASTMYAFEPEPEEAARLSEAGDARWKDFHVLPFAVGYFDGKSDLYIPEGPAGASLLEHNPEMLDRFGYPNLHSVTRCVPVDTVTLDTLAISGKIGRVDYMKLDIEGPELPVMEAGKTVLDECVAIKTECSFLEQRLKQPLTWDVASFLLGEGFEIVDIRDIHRWRRKNLPAHPYIAGEKMPYSRGQISQCDLVALRSPDACNSVDQSLRLAAMSAVLGYFDYSVNVVRHLPALQELIAEKYGFDWESELGVWSSALGKQSVRTATRAQVRGLVPLIRSILGKLPYSRSADEAY